MANSGFLSIRVLEDGDPVFFSITWMLGCVGVLAREHISTRMQGGCVLQGTFGSCPPCGCYFDKCYVPTRSYLVRKQKWSRSTTSLTWPPNSPRSASKPASVGGSAVHGGPTSTGLEGRAAKFLVPDTANTTAHLQGSGGVKASMDRGGFSSKGGWTQD